MKVGDSVLTVAGLGIVKKIKGNHVVVLLDRLRFVEGYLGTTFTVNQVWSSVNGERNPK